MSNSDNVIYIAFNNDNSRNYALVFKNKEEAIKRVNEINEMIGDKEKLYIKKAILLEV